MKNFFLAITLLALLLYGCCHTLQDPSGGFARPAMIQEIFWDLQDDPTLANEPEHWPTRWAESHPDREAIIQEAVTLWIYRRGE